MDHNALPTIGIGYALMFSNHKPRETEKIKADMQEAMDPEHYAEIRWNRVDALLKEIQDHFKHGGSLEEVKESVGNRIEHYNRNEGNRALGLSTEEEKKLLINTSLPGFEKKLDAQLDKPLPYSTERIAVISQLYRLGSAPSMIKAINEGNRAEAWYQIRYNSNADNAKGNYSRVIEESDLFGLHDKYPNAKNEKDIETMFSQHKEKIREEEKKSPLYEESNKEHGAKLEVSLDHTQEDVKIQETLRSALPCIYARQEQNDEYEAMNDMGMEM